MLPRNQILRFVLVGSANTAFSYGLYALFLWFGLPYPVANLLAFVISLLVSFRTQGLLVFGNSEKRLIWRYVLAWCAIYVINVGLIASIRGLGLNDYAAGAVALGPVTAMSYVIQKFLVFAPRRPDVQASSKQCN